MAVIYMKHARHGMKVAVSEEEAKADEKNGWERFTRDGPKAVNPEATEPLKVAPKLEQPTIVDRQELAGEYERRFGKKPHHRMSVERMAAELKAA